MARRTASTERLMRYWAHGEGAAKIRWGVPGDFNRCRLRLGKYVKGDKLDGLCANLHRRATGAWPGHAPGERHSRKASDMDTTSVFAEIVKSTPQEDGSLLVEGRASDSSLDLDQQICDPEWLAKAMPEWFRIGNIREQHDPKRAVGKATEYEAREDGHWIAARVVDPVAKAKCEAGVFTGFSIGVKNPRVVKCKDAPGGKITDGQIIEVSLVDRPANPNATLTVCKAAEPGWEGSPQDLDEERGLVRCEELDLTEKSPEPEPKTEESPSDSKAADADAPDAPEESNADADPADRDSFDSDAAKALVEATLAKDQEADIETAEEAIRLISGLIASEAAELAVKPAESHDIRLLLNAVTALREYIHCEQDEDEEDRVVSAVSPRIEADDDSYEAGADADNEPVFPESGKAKYSAEELQRLLKEGKAMRNADGEPSYPIADVEDLENAIRAVGRGGADHDAIRRHIIRRAKALGKMDMLPENWTSSGSLKAAEAAAVKAQLDSKEKATEVTEPTENVTATKAVDVEGDDQETLVKALTKSLEDEDAPLRKMFQAIVKGSTEPVAEAVKTLTERLERVEQMATPGGPVLRRTEAERNQARKQDLLAEAGRYKTLSNTADDPDLRAGYAAKARQLEAQVKALA